MNHRVLLRQFTFTLYGKTSPANYDKIFTYKFALIKVNGPVISVMDCDACNLSL